MNLKEFAAASAMLLATMGSVAALAGPVTGLTPFSSGTPARAGEVNGNFTAVKTAVDDNDSHTASGRTSSISGGASQNVFGDHDWRAGNPFFADN